MIINPYHRCIAASAACSVDRGNTIVPSSRPSASRPAPGPRTRILYARDTRTVFVFGIHTELIIVDDPFHHTVRNHRSIASYILGMNNFAPIVAPWCDQFIVGKERLRLIELALDSKSHRSYRACVCRRGDEMLHSSGTAAPRPGNSLR